MRNLIYVCVFHNKEYVKLLSLLLRSIKEYGDFDSNVDTDFVIFTHRNFYNDISGIVEEHSLSNVYIRLLELETIVQSKYARLLIFEYERINEYEKILYLDTDILIVKPLRDIFSHELQERLYAVQECDISGEYFGKHLFDFNKIHIKTPAFNSGVLLFKNCDVIKELFRDILNHILEYQGTVGFGSCVDQPFFNYHAITKGIQETKLMFNYSINNPYAYKTQPKIAICHFAGSYGSLSEKYKVMETFLCNVC